MKKKLFFGVLLSVVLTASLLTGCGSNSTPAPTPATQTGGQQTAAQQPAAQPQASTAEPVTIHFWGGWTGPDVDTMRGIIDKYMANNSHVTIEFESQQWTPLFTKFLAEASAGASPDIMAMRPMDMGQFIEMGLMDDSFAETIGIDKNNYSEAAWEGTMYNNKQYGIPLDQHMHGLYYNQDLFDKAGITEAPKTGDDLIAAAQKLTLDKNGNNASDPGFDANNIAQYGFGFNINHHVGFQMSALLSQQGEVPFTQDMKTIGFDSGKATAALQYLQDFVFKYKVTPIGQKSPIDDFIAGNIAMLIDGPWQMPRLEESGLNWKSAPYPEVFGKQVAWGNEHIFVFPKNKSNESQKQAVRDFMVWMDQNSGEWAKSGQIPASNGGLEVAKTLPGRQAFIDSMANMYLLPASPKSAELFGSSATSPFVVAAQDLMLDNKPAAEVVEQLKKEMDAILSTP